MKKIALALVALGLLSSMALLKIKLYPKVNETIKVLTGEFSKIPEDRKVVLKKIALFIENKSKANTSAELVFICNHNSRRSHISQIWSSVAAAYYEVPNVNSYSGGVESGAFSNRAVKALQDVGFEIEKKSDATNPVYEVRFSDEAPPIKSYSKKYNAGDNPKKGFAAIKLDKVIPTVLGAEESILMPYDDPKLSMERNGKKQSIMNGLDR